MWWNQNIFFSTVVRVIINLGSGKKYYTCLHFTTFLLCHTIQHLFSRVVGILLSSSLSFFLNSLLLYSLYIFDFSCVWCIVVFATVFNERALAGNDSSVLWKHMIFCFNRITENWWKLWLKRSSENESINFEIHSVCNV